jgi:ferric-dicitrate binding protein FerR (iron transport regulator)
MLFRVQFDKGQIEVLGTHFNVNTYSDENDVQTLLLEGVVKITNTPAAGPAPQSLVLKPGQQVAFNAGEEKALNKEVDIGQVMVWKDGYFRFDNTNLKLIMKQLSRWYDLDLDVDYELNDDPRFSFKMNGRVNITKLLKILQKTGTVRFEIDSKTIKVLKGQHKKAL